MTATCHRCGWTNPHTTQDFTRIAAWIHHYTDHHPEVLVAALDHDHEQAQDQAHQ